MKKLLLLLLFPVLLFAQVQIGEDITPASDWDQSGRSISLSSDGHTVAIGCVPILSGNTYTRARIYSYNNNNWEQKGQTIEVTQADSLSNTTCNVSLSSDGNTIALGIPGFDNNKGMIKILQYINDTWIQIGQNINGSENDSTGSSIDISADGTILAVTSMGNGDFELTGNQGNVKIYELNNSEWVQKGEAINGYFNNYFDFLYMYGSIVSISDDGNVFTMSCNSVNDDIRDIRVYKFMNGSWELSGEFPPKEEYFHYGSSLSISGDGNTIVTRGTVGGGDGSIPDTKNYVLIYRFINNSWSQIGQRLQGEAYEDLYGFSTSISYNGELIAISAPETLIHQYAEGRTKLYKYNGSEWIQHGQNIDGAMFDIYSGMQICLSGNGGFLASCLPNASNYPYVYSGVVKVYDLTNILSSSNFDKENFILYPNPAQNEINFNADNNIKIQNIKIYNSLGQLVKDTELNSVDISTLPDGVYFAQIVTSQNTMSKSFIKKL